MPILLLLLFALTRLWNLTLLPVFTDEANYIDWGWRSINIPNHLFYSLYDAKQPLLMWVFGLAQKIFANPLFASRIVSVFTGLLTFWGLYTLAKYLYDRQTAILACLVYTTIPLFLLFDRQALMESSLSAIGTWSLYFLTKYLNRGQYRDLMLLGAILGIGFFIKSSTLLLLAPTVFILIIKLKTRAAIPLLLLLLTVYCVCFPLFMQSSFWKTISFNSRYSAGLLGPWWKNFTGISDILFWQLTPLIYLGSLWVIYKHRTQKILLLWTFVPLILTGLTATYVVSRYVVYLLPPLTILLARLNRKYLLAAIIPALLLSVLQIFSPIRYFHTLKRVSNNSYIEGYVSEEASGYAAMAAVKRLNEISAGQPISLGLALFSGNPESGLLIYFRPNSNILPAYLDAQLLGANIINSFDCLKYHQPLFLASRAPDKAGLKKYFDDFEIITNPVNSSRVYLSKLKENCAGKTLSLTLQRE